MEEYNLYWARGLRPPLSGKEIELTDPELETAAVLRLFFTVITTLHLPLEQFKDGDLTTLTNFLLFLRKWDAKQLYSFVLDCVHAAVKEVKLLPLRVFQLGAVLDEVDTCVVAMHHPSGEDPWWEAWWPAYVRNPFNPCGWSLRFYKENKIPSVFLLALSQAMGQPSCPEDHFKGYLEKAKETDRRL